MIMNHSLPGALGMYGLSIGVSTISSSLPRAAYALLSGLNAATVGIIALAAVELSEEAITDRMTRTLVFFGGAAGMLYSALWYFPLLMVASGCVAVCFDYRWLHRPVKAVVRIFKRKEEQHNPVEEAEVELAERRGEETSVRSDHSVQEGRTIPEEYRLGFSWKAGMATISAFLATFIVVMVLRGILVNPPLLYSLFANMYLAGTVIFGGGPVVIPLLREYVVAQGWVSSRDFLIGLALIQALPGPNFNFAVFLGSLTAINGGYSSVSGAVVGFVGIFIPGIVLVQGTMGLWSALRGQRWVKSSLRGVHASAVGLIYTAVYRLWQIGYIDQGFESGISLDRDPWWVVVVATSFVGGRWYGIKPPFAIILGAVMGLIRYGVVSRSG